MELQYAKPRSQKPTSGPCPKPAQTSSKFHVVPCLQPHSNITLLFTSMSS